MMTLETFSAYAAEFSVVPIVRERPADESLPIRLAELLQDRSNLFLLESLEDGESQGRYTYMGFDATRAFVIRDGNACTIDGTQETVLDGNPIDALQEFINRFQAPSVDGLPRFFGGLVGYLSFDAVRFFERCGEVQENTSAFPDAHFFVCDRLIVFDRLEQCLKLICCVYPADHDDAESAYLAGVEVLDGMDSVLDTVPPLPTLKQQEPAAAGEIEVTSNMSPEEYQTLVRRAKEYINDGDIIQVVLAQHFSCITDTAPFEIYCALRRVNPSPYMYFLKLNGALAIAGSSPEVLVRVNDGLAEVRPIAGTRPRGRNNREDKRLIAELAADPKEQAEHVMLVDLARNDLGRVSELGSVKVTDYMGIEKYSHVIHLVSNVVGKMRKDTDAIDVLRASFPAGTLSGAPKVRAMEIIHELEPIARGPYGGALGYIGFGGQVMDLAITIRTIVMENDRATVTAGAGIVYDSVPEREHAECCNKSAGMIQALAVAAGPLPDRHHSTADSNV